MISLRKVTGKKLVSFLRNGDFAHAGETDAINMVMRKLKKNPNQQILDAGCGLGGTANYIQEQKWGTVTAFDIEQDAIKHAKETYPNIDFYISDVANIHNIIPSPLKFEVICLFNSFYAFPDQKLALESLRQVAKKNSQLAIFDYSDPCAGDKKTPLLRVGDEDLAPSIPIRAPFIPIRPSDIEKTLVDSGWIMKELVDISEKYQVWYDTLVSSLETKKNEVIKSYGEEAYIRAYATYTEMQKAIKNNVLGGVIVYAEKA